MFVLLGLYVGSGLLCPCVVAYFPLSLLSGSVWTDLFEVFNPFVLEFVLSEAGKSIFSRYGSVEALSATMGVMMALVSFVQSARDGIQAIYAENHKLVFLQQGPLVLGVVSLTQQSAAVSGQVVGSARTDGEHTHTCKYGPHLRT